MAKLIVERWVKQKDELSGEEVERIVEEAEVKSEVEAKRVADEFRAKEGTSRVTLHYCRHDEGKPCTRMEI